MRYYEIVKQPETQTATDHNAWDDRHLQHDAGQIVSVALPPHCFAAPRRDVLAP